MTKDFDCVEIKRKAQLRIVQALNGLDAEEERQYWRERGKELKDLREGQLQEKADLHRSSLAK